MKVDTNQCAVVLLSVLGIVGVAESLFPRQLRKLSTQMNAKYPRLSKWIVFYKPNETEQIFDRVFKLQMVAVAVTILAVAFCYLDGLHH